MKPRESPQRKLAFFFQRNGYIRLPKLKRQEDEGYKVYKKGYEVRLVAHSKSELRTIRGLLKLTGFKVAKSHEKAN